MNNITPNTMQANGGMLSVTAPAAPTAAPGANRSANKDERMWRPVVTKDNPEYVAVIRTLPKGRDLNAYPATCVLVHRIRDMVTGKVLYDKCCKNNPNVRTCPYCEDAWGRYNEAKKRPGITKEQLTKFLQQTADEEWWQNIYIRQDQNHPELNGTVKVWAMSRGQHNRFQKPVDNWNAKHDPSKQVPGAINVDTGDDFIPYDPMQGRDYYIAGKWDPEKSYGGRRKGAPTYDGSTFVKDSTPLAYQMVQDQATGALMYQPDQNQMLAILDQCHDLSFAYDNIPTPEQATANLAQFWDECAKAAAERQQYGGARGAGNQGYQQPQQGLYGQTPVNYAAQPFATGMPGVPQNNIPQVPSNANISMSSDPAAFMGQAAQMPPPIPESAAPATPAFAPAPIPATMPGPAPVQAAPAAPAYAAPAAPAAPAMAPAAPAMAPAAPAAPSYVPPAAPPVQQPMTQFAQPAAQQVNPAPIVETDGDDDLPF